MTAWILTCENRVARRRGLSRRVSLVAALSLMACTDYLPSAAPVTDPPAVEPSFEHLRGTVDASTGTLTFERVPSQSGSHERGGGINAAIYGDQGVTVRIYNSPVVVTPVGAGKKRFSANVGIRNLMAHPVGDEQAGLPFHNLGIFVFVSAGPTVTGTSSPCIQACTVSVVRQHGIFAFSAPGQRYWFWPERLARAGLPGDTTANRVTWTFEADTQVTTFRFDVLVSAAWPPPQESRWKVNYGGDSLPNLGTEPGWVRSSAGGSVSTSINSPGVGVITVNTPGFSNLTYFRIDSLNTTTNAYIEARFRVNNGLLLTAPEISFGIDDQIKFIAVGVNGSQAGFLNSSLTFLGSSTSVSTNTLSHLSDQEVPSGQRGALHRRHAATPQGVQRPPAASHGFRIWLLLRPARLRPLGAK